MKTTMTVTGQHEPTDQCHSQHCYSHHVDEPIADGQRVYITCLECGHVYYTRRDLVRAYRAQMRSNWRHSWSRPALRLRWRTDPATADMRPPVLAWLYRYLFTRARRIFFCQHCIHDF